MFPSLIKSLEPILKRPGGSNLPKRLSRLLFFVDLIGDLKSRYGEINSHHITGSF